MHGTRILLGTLLLLLAAGEAFQVISQQKPAPATQQEFRYDKAKEVTLLGKIQEVRDYKCPVTGTLGTHISVKNDQSVTEVHLAPAKFLKEYDIVFKPGDEVKVIGATIDFEGKPAMLAQAVTVGKETFAFRDKDGKPLW